MLFYRATFGLLQSEVVSIIINLYFWGKEVIYENIICH